ncbi:MAG: hypothetical protein U0H60_06395 [Lachnospiraceae bacterium]|nr:hypothetical protein [Lachnospiraceae bacterium]
MRRRDQKVIAAVLLVLLAGIESIRGGAQAMSSYAAEPETNVSVSFMPVAGDEPADAPNSWAEILLEGTVPEEERADLQGSASDVHDINDVHDVNIEETFSADLEPGLTITSIETEPDPMAEGCGGAGEASAALNGAVSGEDTKEKQSTTVADGEASVEQTEGLESELSTECTEPATEAPVSEKVHLGIDNRHRYEGMEQSFADGYQPEIRDGKLYLTVPFTASGALQNECLTVDLIFAEKENAPFVFKNYQKDVKLHSYRLQDGIMTPQGTDTKGTSGNDLTATEVPGGIANQDGIASPADQQDAYCYTCEVPLQENATPGQYSVTVRAWGYTMDGERVNLDCQIFVRVPEPEPVAGSKDNGSGGGAGGGGGYSGGESGEAAEEILHQPKLLLETCSLSDVSLKAGAEEPMKVQFRNRSETQTIYNLKVTASTDTKAVQPLRNSWYFSSVAPGETVAIEDGVKVAMATEDTSAVLSFDFEYEDKKGTAVSGKESMPLLIGQPTEVELHNAAFPAVLYATDTQEFSIQALNLSRVPVYNVRIQLSGTGLFPAEDVFIGNMDAGTEGNGAMQVYVGTKTMQAIGDDSGTEDVEKYGSVNGTITLQYEDASGETHTQTETFQSEIKKPKVLSLEADDTQETNAWWISIFAAVGAGMLLVIVVLALRLRKKSALLHDTRYRETR